MLAQNSVPPCPVPGISYSNAPLLDCCLDGYQYATLPGGGLEAPAGFCGTMESGQWLAFRPGKSVIEMTFGLEVENCGNANGVEMQVFGIGNGCSLDSLFPVSDCIQVTGEDSTVAAGLVPGHVYYLLLDGNLGDICEYTISVLNEVDTCDAPSPYLDGPTSVNAGQTATYSIVIPPDTCFFENQNPCGNVKQDTVSCAALCNPQPLSFTWTGPPGSTVVPSPDGYSAQVTFGTESGLVCVQLTDGCFHFDGCLPVDVCDPDPPVIAGFPIVTGCEPAWLEVLGNFVDFQWSSGENSPQIFTWFPGTYSVTVTDAAGCISSTTINVNQVPFPTVFISGQNTVCPGSAVNLTAIGAGPNLFYQWNTGASQPILPVSGAGTYSVTVTDQFGCTDTDNFTVTALPAPNPVIQSSTGSTLPPVGTSTLDAGAGFAAYGWSNGASSQTITVSNPGTYAVTVTAANGCTGSASFDLGPAASGFTGEDCPGAMQICTGEPLFFPGVQGPGQFDPIQSTSCFDSPEHQSQWFTFEFSQGGTFEFMVFPSLAMGGADFDFVLYEGGCPQSGGIAVTCNWTGPVTPPGPFLPTGIATDPVASFGVPPNNEIVQTVNVLPNTPYYLLIDNITENGVGFDIEFGGTALIGGSGAAGPTCAEAPVVPCPCWEAGLTGWTDGPNVTDQPSTFCGNIENEEWLAFQACWCTVTIEIEAGTSTNGGGVEAQLFAGCGPDFQPKTNCITVPPGTSGFLSGISCVVGDTYYLMIDGVNGDSCEYTVTITEVPGHPVMILQDTIFGPNRVCAGDTVTYLAPPVANAAHCTFTFDGDSSQVIDPNHNSATVVFGSESGLLCFVAQNCTSFDSVCMFVQVDTATFTTADTLLLCEEELPFDYDGLSIGAAGLYLFDTLQSVIGCDSFLQVFVEILPPPQVEISVSGPVNAGNASATLANTFFTTPNDQTYLWTGPGITPANQNEYAPVVTLPGTYSLTVTDTLTGCSATASATVLESLCANYDLPAPPGDSCAEAPLFCGENLDGFCSNNGSATADPALDTVFGCPVENGQWIRFTPCETDVELTITTGNCVSGDGLEAAVLAGDSCANFTQIQSCTPLAPDVANSFTVSGLTPGEIYYLVIDGANGDACDYRIEVVSGISTEVPQWVTVNDGYVTGPSPVCVGDQANYFIVPPECELLWGGTGGCPVPPEACPESNDSTAMIWHIPTVASFLSDSVNVDTILVQWNGLPTPGDDSIWVEFQYFPDTTGGDSLTFCACTGSCGGAIDGMTVEGQFFTENLTAELTCASPTVDFCGETISAAGVYTCPIFCGEQILTVTENFFGEIFDLGVIELCPGECFDLMGETYCDAGTYEIEIPNPSNGCPDTYIFTLIIVNEAQLQTGPVTELCDATGQFYTVGFSILSGTPPYFVDGVQIPGNFYQSPQLPAGNAYAFEVTDAATCNPGAVMLAGVWDCPCIINAGSVDQELLSHCEGQLATASFNNDAQLGSDDILVFILHTGSGPALGDVLGVNTTGIFSFDPGSMSYGQTYYISPVAGNDAGGTVDLSDGCLSVGPGQPVVFYEIPMADVLPPATLTCDVTEVTLDPFVGGGSGQFSFEWSGPGGFFAASQNPDVPSPGDYELTLTDDLTGCTSSATVTVEEDVAPPDLAATGGELNCAQSEVTLQAASATPGVVFTWTLPDGTEFQGETWTADVPGSYPVIAAAPNGCTTEAVAEVVEVPAPDLLADVESKPPTCFGDADGFIKINGVSDGTGPYVFTLDGQAMPGDVFENLPSGEYLLAVEDANGCTAELLIELPQPQEVTVELGEDRFVRLGGSVTLEFVSGIVPADIQWTGPGGQTWAGESSLQLQPMESGRYTIVISDIHACSASDEVFVTVQGGEKVFIPSAFSPNGDGQNDVFMIYAGPDVRLVRSFYVFDRWGEKVYEGQNFQPNDPAHGWDGSLDGKNMQAAVFVYVTEVEFLNGETKMFKGDVVLVR